MDKIILIIVALFITPCFATQPLPQLTVVSEEWQGYTNADGTGTYWDIVRAVYGNDYQLEMVTTTWSRAINLVEKGRADILVGSYKRSNRNLRFPQHHLDIEYPIYAIFDESIHTITEVNDLADLVIAGRKDYDLAKFLPSSSRLYGVEAIDDVAQLIKRKRVDAALSYRVNLALADPDNLYKHQAIGTEEALYLAFTQSNKGEKLQTHYDNKIIDLVQNDQLRQYFLNVQEYQHAQLDKLLPLPMKNPPLK